MKTYDLAIIGSGASGLSAAVAAKRNGVNNIIILEKDSVMGGNLNLFINDGFGEYYLRNKVTGPELSSMLIEEYKSRNGEYKVNSQVLDINNDKIITYINPEDGVAEIKAKVIIVASGCREKYTGNIVVPINKYTGIFTTAVAHRLVNYQGYLPGKNIILIGNNIWTAILARRLVIEGAKVKMVMTKFDSFQSEANQILDDFNISKVCNSEIIEISGVERMQSAKIKDMIKNKVTNVECDSLILSVGYLPEVDYLKKLNLRSSKGFVYHTNNELDFKGIFICGTATNGREGLLTSGSDGYEVGLKVAEYMNEMKWI